MKKILIAMVSVAVFSSLGIFVIDGLITPQHIEADTITVTWDGQSNIETNTQYTINFEQVTYDSDEIPDTYAIPDGYNGVYIDTIDGNLTNYALPKLDGSSVITRSDFDIISLSEEEAWRFISDDYFMEYPTQSYSDVEDILKAMHMKYATTISVKVWYWANPSDDTDMSKITTTASFTVNSKLKTLWEHIFEDIYNQSSKPVINIEDRGMGTWAIRGKNHNPNNTPSAHAMGTAIDINPSTGSFNIGGVWYGNAYGQRVMDTKTWKLLPECHEKYQILYSDCPIVQVFKSYGFYWGGDWSDTKDNMHFGYLGDSCGRKQGYSNYVQYKRK